MVAARVRDHRTLAAAAAVFTVVLVLSLLGWIALLSFAASNPFPGRPVPSLVDSIHVVGSALVFALVGFGIWWRRPGNVIGPLMVVIGAIRLTWSYEWLPIPPLVTLAQAGWAAPPILIGVLLLLHPTGRVDSRLERGWLVGAGALAAFSILHAFVTPSVKKHCLDCRSWLTLIYDESVSTNVWVITMNALAVMAVVLIALLARRWLRASAPMRRVMAPLWVAGLAFVLIVLGAVIVDTDGSQHAIQADIPTFAEMLPLSLPPFATIVWPYVATFALVLVPLALLWSHVRSHWGEAAVGALAVQLRDEPVGESLVGYLRDAVGDPSLRLVFWSRPAQTYVTADGTPIELPEDDETVTRIDSEGGPIAALVHDAALKQQTGLIDGVSAVAQFAIENQRLHAEVRAQLEEVRASRRRLVSAADEERRRVERNIHDGAQQRLVTLSIALAIARVKAGHASPEVRATIARAEAELKLAIKELRELARGIHPSILNEAGLPAALESLAEQAPLPVAVHARIDGRLPPVVEATAYFVAAEALTNVAKHSGASSAAVHLTRAHGMVRLEVVDDGSGGADASQGSGIRGMIDRVAALGGELRVGSGGDGGTRLEALIPCV